MLNDLPLERILILGVEGKKTNEHLVHDDADGPPVRCKGITFAFDQLRGEVLGCASLGCAQIVTLGLLG